MEITFENFIIKDYSENANSYRVLFFSVPVWTVENGGGRWGTAGDGGGRWGTVGFGSGRLGGRGRMRRGRDKNRHFHCIIL